MIGWDTHAHVFGDAAQFPFAAGRGYTPAPASLDAYLEMLDRHGIARGVLVQPSVYGFDNRCLLAALDEAGGRLRGIAVPAPDTPSSDFESMHRRGVRGVRCNVCNPGGLTPDVVVGWQPVLAALGWHVEVQIAVTDVPHWRRLFDGLTVPLVIDHMGRPGPGRADVEAPSVKALVDAVREGACLVKISAPYRTSRLPPPWPDVTPLARALIDTRPAGCVWASDWPHVDVDAPVQTDDVIEAWRQWNRPEAGPAMSAAADRLYGDD